MKKEAEPAWIKAFFDDGLYELEYGPDLADSRNVQEAELISLWLALEPEHSVLDVACGHGRHALHIAQQVRRIVGVDRSSRFIELARCGARSLELPEGRAEFVLGDVRNMTFQAEFDRAYCFFTSWGYHSDAENIKVLEGVSRALRPGGWFLLETAARDGILRNWRFSDKGELPDGTKVTIENSLDFASGRIHALRKYHYREPKIVEIVHHLVAPDELVRLLRAVGFTKVTLLDGATGETLGLDSLRLAAIAVKGS